MSGRPAAPPGAQTLRVEVLKELQQLIDNREARDKIDKGPLAEAKGREHWVLHLLLRAQESTTAHFDTLIGTAYSNLVARMQAGTATAGTCTHCNKCVPSIYTGTRCVLDHPDPMLTA